MSEQNEIQLTEEMLANAAAAGEKELERPRAKAVRYDAERVRLIIELVSGAMLDRSGPANLNSAISGNSGQ